MAVVVTGASISGHRVYPGDFVGHFIVGWLVVPAIALLFGAFHSSGVTWPGELQAQLKPAFEHWYGFRDVPGKNREAKDAEKKVHHIQRALGDHIAKHGCTRDA